VVSSPSGVYSARSKPISRLRARFIDATLVDDLMSSHIVTYWQKLGPVAVEYREKMNSPTNAEFSEYLYNVVYEIWKREHPETPRSLQSQ
jgi:hypothetical protein